MSKGNYIVDVLYNTDIMAMLHGYQPGDKLEFEGIITINGDDIPGVVSLCDRLFTMCNDINPNMPNWLSRNMSMGDVIRIHDWPNEYVALTRKGWGYVSKPAWIDK